MVAISLVPLQMKMCATKLKDSSECDLHIGSYRVVHHPANLKVQEFISLLEKEKYSEGDIKVQLPIKRCMVLMDSEYMAHVAS